jgi:hypothetical protein
MSGRGRGRGRGGWRGGRAGGRGAFPGLVDDDGNQVLVDKENGPPQRYPVSAAVQTIDTAVAQLQGAQYD